LIFYLFQDDLRRVRAMQIFQRVVAQIPHLGELTVERFDFVSGVNHQNAARRRFKRRLQQREISL
jgi:hypothetical protein